METQPRKRDADRSRAEILDAAERLFAAQGFDVVTMADIGAAAGVSRGTPGYFFGQKEQLYRIVLERAAATFRMLGETLRLRDAGGQRDRATLLRETVESFLGLLAARRDVVRLLDRDGGEAVGSPHVEAVMDALSALGDERSELALTIVSLAWYPIAHPEAAAEVGIAVDDVDFVATWSARILDVIAGLPSELAVSGRAKPRAKAPAPKVASGVVWSPDDPAPAPVDEEADKATTKVASGVVWSKDYDPDDRFKDEVILSDLKKKKKKKKKKKDTDTDV